MGKKKKSQGQVPRAKMTQATPKKQNHSKGGEATDCGGGKNKRGGIVGGGQEKNDWQRDCWGWGGGDEGGEMTGKRSFETSWGMGEQTVEHGNTTTGGPRKTWCNRGKTMSGW